MVLVVVVPSSSLCLMIRGVEGSALCGRGKSMTASLEISNFELWPKDQFSAPFGHSIISLSIL